MDEALIDRIRRGPAILFLGQKYLTQYSGRDLLLDELVSRSGHRATGYRDLIESGAVNLESTSFDWMQERCRRIVLPPALELVAAQPWNGLVTSAIDTAWQRAFRTEWRDIYYVTTSLQNPEDYRNRLRLHATCLYGIIDGPEEAKPPMRKLELRKRNQEALTLLSRLPSLVTPLGVVIIDAYDLLEDCLNPDDFAAILNELGSQQVHAFEASDDLAQHELFADLIKQGKLICHSESLSTFLQHAIEKGLLAEPGRLELESDHFRIELADRQYLHIPHDIFVEVSKEATVLDDALMQEPAKLAKPALFFEFRNFLSESSYRPQWPSLLRSFPFERDYYSKLAEVVEERLSEREAPTQPILLHGQTGSGKTVALSQLAVRVRRAKRYPVLYIERKPKDLEFQIVSSFVEWIEANWPATHQHKNTLVVWDGMADPTQYAALQNYCLSRGKRVVIVGSCYRLDGTGKLDKKHVVEAPGEFSSREIEDFPGYLQRFGMELDANIIKRAAQDGTFLALLYRLLDPARRAINEGVSREIRQTEEIIWQRSKVGQQKPLASPLVQALQKAGLLNLSIVDIPFEPSSDEVSTPMEMLTGLLSVPGQFGINVSVDLLLRCLKLSTLTDLPALMRGLDMFRWDQDEVGNVSLGVRQPLEAQIVTHGRYTPDSEIQFACTLIEHISEHPDSPEVDFAIELVRRMGPSGEQLTGKRYHRLIDQLRESLTKLRKERSIKHPRVMQQEAYLVREHVKNLQAHPLEKGLPASLAVEKLMEARSVLDEAISMLQANRQAKLRSSLLTERASNLGTEIVERINSGLTDRLRTLVSLLRDDVRSALAISPSNTFGIDVIGWAAIKVKESGILGSEEMAELSADVLFLFDSLEDDLTFESLQLQETRIRVNREFGRVELSDKFFDNLLEKHPSAAHFLRARQILGGGVPHEDDFDEDTRKRAEQALSYLFQNLAAISRDSRCLVILIRLWWICRTGHTLFYGERIAVPLKQSDWKVLEELTGLLLANEATSWHLTAKYLKALSLFHLGQSAFAFDLFRELSAESIGILGSLRVQLHYVASTDSGEPRRFSGEISQVNEDSDKGWVFVRDIGQRIPFQPRRFGYVRVKAHQPLSFSIGFNFLGPIADPGR